MSVTVTELRPILTNTCLISGDCSHLSIPRNFAKNNPNNTGVKLILRNHARNSIFSKMQSIDYLFGTKRVLETI